MMFTTKLLSSDDEPALLAFLHQYPESSLFLLANLQNDGLSDSDETDRAIYAAAVIDDTIQGIASLTNQGMILLQAPAGAAATVRQVVSNCGRKIQGIAGPWQQVVDVGADLELAEFPVTTIGRESLFTLELSHLLIPDPLTHPGVECRLATVIDLDLITSWRLAFRTEVFGERLQPPLVDAARSELQQEIAKERLWLLSLDGVPIAMSAVNAQVSTWVQIGGVYTVPEYRNRGLARAVVAASLLAAQQRGIECAVLFTGEHNYPAQTAYQSLGFRYAIDFSLVLFTEPISVDREFNPTIARRKN
jgi:uncharacterized protein